MAADGKFPVEREFAYRALSSCTKNEGSAAALERALPMEGPSSRKAILEGLEGQGRRESLDSLLELYDRLPDPKEELRIYRDLRLIADPTERERLLPLFLRGLHSRSLEIRRESLLGLGKIEARDASENIVTFFKSKNRDLVLAALDAAGRIGTEEMIHASRPLLHSRDPEIQKKSIELFRQLGTARAMDALVELEYHGILPENSALLWSAMDSLRNDLAPEWSTASTTDFARLYSAASSDATVTAVVRPGTSLYVRRIDDTLHRRTTTRPDLLDTWVEVRSGDGLSGYVTSSSLRIYDANSEP